jgi:hypothetical protein
MNTRKNIRRPLGFGEFQQRRQLLTAWLSRNYYNVCWIAGFFLIAGSRGGDRFDTAEFVIGLALITLAALHWKDRSERK